MTSEWVKWALLWAKIEECAAILRVVVVGVWKSVVVGSLLPFASIRPPPSCHALTFLIPPKHTQHNTFLCVSGRLGLGYICSAHYYEKPVRPPSKYTSINQSPQISPLPALLLGNKCVFAKIGRPQTELDCAMAFQLRLHRLPLSDRREFAERDRWSAEPKSLSRVCWGDFLGTPLRKMGMCHISGVTYRWTNGSECNNLCVYLLPSFWGKKCSKIDF